MRGIGKVAKAIYAAVVAVLGSLAAVLVGDVGIGDLSSGQWVAIILAGVLAAGGVYGIRNAE